MSHNTIMQRQVKVIIVGAGLGGLACAIACRQEGIETIVLERAPKIEPVGAGIQIPPNAARVLERFGLLEEIKRKGTVLDSLSLRRYKDGLVLCERPLGRGFHATFGVPWIVIHRHDYHAILLDEATRLGADIVLGQHITKVDVLGDRVVTVDGTEWAGDVVIGADGLWSDVRNQILDVGVEPLETGDLAYRGTFSKEQLLSLKDPKVEELCAKSAVTLWLGPDKHSVFYPVRNGQYFNLVLLRPDDLPQGCRTTQGDISEMRATFEGWDPILTEIISCIPSVLKWKLCHFPELQTWAKNHTVLLGDACHPTLPYQAQGAAMAVEDGAVLGHLLGMSTRAPPSSDAIPAALRLYEAERKSRTTLNIAGAAGNRTFYHLHDGPRQQARDAEMRAFDWENGCSATWKWLDLAYQQNLLGHDAVESADRAFAQMISEDAIQV